jgi:DnaJ-class molecular chaperone
MEKSKKVRHKAICPTCDGNGFIKIVDNYKETNIHQCWDCESQGEFYVDESEVVEFDADYTTDDDVKLH